MFCFAESFNHDSIGEWDTSAVTDMNNMFFQATSFNQDSIGTWNTAAVTDMSKIFMGAKSFDASITGWDTSAVTDMSDMFQGASSFNQDVSGWDMSSVWKAEGMFYMASSFNQFSIEKWNITNLLTIKVDSIDATAMFDELVLWSERFGQNIRGPPCWYLDIIYKSGQPSSEFYSFVRRPTGNEIPDNKCLGEFKPQNFMELRKATEAWVANPAGAIGVYGAIGSWNISEVNDLSGLFEKLAINAADIALWNVSHVVDLSRLFAGARFEVPLRLALRNWDTSQVTSMAQMFYETNAVDLFRIGLESWDTGSVVDASEMFAFAGNFEDKYDSLQDWDMASCTTTAAMFHNAMVYNGDVSRWQISGLKSADSMFQGATKFAPPTLTKWDTSSLTSMVRMFFGAVSFNATGIGAWDVGRVNDMTGVFDSAVRFNQPLNWDISSATVMTTMFAGASAFKQHASLDRWKTTAVADDTDMAAMFSKSGMEPSEVPCWHPVGRSAVGRVVKCPLFDMAASWDPSSMSTMGAEVLNNISGALEYNPDSKPVYQLGETYETNTPGSKVADSDSGSIFENPAGSKFEAIAFIARCRKEGNSSSDSTNSSALFSGGQCPGKFFVTDDGEMLIKVSKEGSFTAELVARDAAGDETVVKRWGFQVLQADTDAAEDTNACGDGTAVEAIDSTKYDNYFVCDCDDGFVGDRCETYCANGKTADGTRCNPDGSAAGGLPGEQVTAIIISLVAVFSLIVAVVKYRAYKESMRPIDFDELNRKMLENGTIVEGQLASDRKPRELKRSSVLLLEQVGSGAFGAVWKAVLDESASTGRPEYQVAAKTIKDADASPEATEDLMTEAAVMAQLSGHKNLVSIIGVVTSGNPLILVLVYCDHGSMIDHLKKRAAKGTAVSDAHKLDFAAQTARGMEYLSYRHFIHRDLAARNVLLASGQSMSNVVCKVADFGLSRAGGKDQHEDGDASVSENYYKSQNGVFAVRWTAPEAMESLKFTQASDMWSFGIVLVEIAQDGDRPYPTMRSNADVMFFTIGGNQHPRPEGCGEGLHSVMKQCLEFEAAARPTFDTIAVLLEAMAAEVIEAQGTNANSHSDSAVAMMLQYEFPQGFQDSVAAVSAEYEYHAVVPALPSTSDLNSGGFYLKPNTLGEPSGDDPEGFYLKPNTLGEPSVDDPEGFYLKSDTGDYLQVEMSVREPAAETQQLTGTTKAHAPADDVEGFGFAEE
jgi:surface protein